MRQSAPPQQSKAVTVSGEGFGVRAPLRVTARVPLRVAIRVQQGLRLGFREEAFRFRFGGLGFREKSLLRKSFWRCCYIQDCLGWLRGLGSSFSMSSHSMPTGESRDESIEGHSLG